jgi:hypothetical protein
MILDLILTQCTQKCEDQHEFILSFLRILATPVWAKSCADRKVHKDFLSDKFARVRDFGVEKSGLPRQINSQPPGVQQVLLVPRRFLLAVDPAVLAMGWPQPPPTSP